MGFSLRRVLDIAGTNALAQVPELLPEVVAWNREVLQHSNGKMHDDGPGEGLTTDDSTVLKTGPRRLGNHVLD